MSIIETHITLTGSRPRFRSYPNDPVVLRAYMHGQESPIFKVEEDARKSYFSVEAETGIVKLRQTIDREVFIIFLCFFKRLEVVVSKVNFLEEK